MNMLMVVIGVLSIVLGLYGPIYDGVNGPWLVALSVFAAIVLPCIPAWFVSRQTLILLDRHPDNPSSAQAFMGRGMLAVRWLLGLSHAALLLATDWRIVCNIPNTQSPWPLVPSLIAMTPFLLTITLIWLLIYKADRGVRQVALEVYLFRGKPIQPVWRVAEYLVYNFRHQVLLVLLPVVLILIARDMTYYVDMIIDRSTADWVIALKEKFKGISHIPDMILGASAIVVAIFTPLILRHVWVTQRLPDGPLRDKLLSLGEHLKMRCRELLIWRAGGATVNAAVMGLIAPLRYVLITDSMLEQMEDRKIEAVYGHEAGHVKRHHIFFLLIFALTSGCLVTIFSARAEAHEWDMTSAPYQIAAAILGGIMLFKWCVLFGYISRHFERQADIYAVRTLTYAGLPCYESCALHGDNLAEKAQPADDDAISITTKLSKDTDVLSPDAPLCRTAAHVFGATLDQVALLNGIVPDSRSWRHGSISSRVATIRDYATHPDKVRKFETHVKRIKWAIFVGASAAALWALTEVNTWQTIWQFVAR